MDKEKEKKEVLWGRDMCAPPLPMQQKIARRKAQQEIRDIEGGYTEISQISLKKE